MSEKESPKRRKSAKKQIDYSDVYYSDIALPDMLYGLLVRSPLQCGELTGIEVPELPEGVSFFSGADITGINEVTTRGESIPVFALKDISYLGQPVGILTGSDETELTEISETIGFTSDFMTFGESLEFTESFNAEQLLCQRNIVYGEPDKAYSEAAHTFEQTFSSALTAPLHERNGVIASFNGKQLDIYSPTHWVSHLRKTVSAVTGIDEDKIIIHKTHGTDCFINDIWYNSLVASQVAVAACRLKKPVKLVYSVDEEATYCARTVPSVIRHRSSADENGTITSLDVCILIDAGAFNPFIRYILDRFVIASTGVYAVKNVRVDAYAIKTNHPPLNCDFEWGDAQAFFAIENHLNYVATQLNLDVVPFTLNHALSDHDSFYARHSTYNMALCLENVVKQSDFLRKNTIYSILAPDRADKMNKTIRGIGVSSSFEGNGFLYPDIIRSKYSLEVTLLIDGSVSIKTELRSPVLKSIWSGIVCKALDIEPSQITFTTDFASVTESDEPDVIASNISIMTQLLKKCCASLQRSRFRQPLPISIKKTFVPSRKTLWDDEAFTGQPFQSTSWASAVTEVEVDTVTYDVSIRDIWISIDGGEILNEKQAENAVRRAVCAIIGDFAEFTGAQSVTPHITFIKSSDLPKEVGNAVYNVLPASFTKALSQALCKSVTTLPVETETIYGILSERDKSE